MTQERIPLEEKIYINDDSENMCNGTPPKTFTVSLTCHTKEEAEQVQAQILQDAKIVDEIRKFVTIVNNKIGRFDEMILVKGLAGTPEQMEQRQGAKDMKKSLEWVKQELQQLLGEEA